ncbi:MAG: hypothetical protein ACOH2E_04810, partial [Candidatus Paracaedibacter sp.]
AQHQREAEAQHQREAEAQHQREAEAQRQLEAEAQHQLNGVIQKKKAQAVSAPNLHPAWAFLRDIKANYLIFDGITEQQAYEIATEEVQTYNLDLLKKEAQQFSQDNLFGTDRMEFMENFNSKLERPLKIVQVPVLTPEQRLTQAIRSDKVRFAYLNKNCEDDVKETAEARAQALINSFEKNLPKDNDVLFFAEKVCQDGGAPDSRIQTRITRARQTFRVIKAISTLDNYFDADAYQKGIQQRRYLYQYMDYKNLGRYTTKDFVKAISDLKGLLNKKENQALDFDRNLTFEKAFDLAKAQDAFMQDQQDIDKAFQNWCGFLQVKANPINDLYKLQASDINGIQGNWALDEDGHIFDLLQEWKEVTGEIDRIARSKRNDPICLNYKKLTYEDKYSALFNIDYPLVSVEQINAIKDDILRAAADECKAGRLVDFGLQDLKEQARLNFASIINFDHLYNDRDHFKARAYLIYTLLPKALVPQDIARPEEGVDNPDVQQKWEEALTTEQYKIGDQLVMSLANCEAGVNRKLGNLEDKFRDILGSFSPKTSGIKAIASVIKELKLERLNELGRNADSEKRKEYNLNTPHVVKQRLRGPLSLGGDYETCSSAGLGCPFMQQNLPIQVIHNMFLPDQPEHVYYHGMADNENRNNQEDPIFPYLPVKEHLTVRRLVEAVYNEFELQTGYDNVEGRPIKEGRIRNEHIVSLLDSDFFQLENMGDAGIYMTGTVFLQERDGNMRSRGPKDLYTREMAFYLLERLGYVEIQENIKKDVYQFDFDEDLPGTTKVGMLRDGKGKTLAELIDEF